MEENQKKKQKQVMFGIIGIAILLIGIVGVTYAFFNYTRTGQANTIRTGRIYFNADQGNSTVTLDNLFPISQTGTITASTPGVGSVKLHITGDTTYTQGVEYLIEAADVTGNGQTALPISIAISYAPTAAAAEQPANSIGTADDSYFTNRGGTTALYKLLSTGSISEGEDILVGYIAPNTAIDGELTILAYLDASNIAITDTYPEKTVYTVKTAGYSADTCETALGEYADKAEVCESAETLQTAINAGSLTAQITALENAGLVTEYTDGTTSDWVHGRTVFTTEQWNALQASGVSFKIRATANEGTWVSEPPTLTLGDDTIALPAGTTTITSNSTGTVTCQSSDTTIATCSVSGTTVTVTGVAEGNATITVNQAATTTYGAITKKFAVRVQNS